MLAWTVFGAAIVAALGAGAALVRYRYRTAIAADSERPDSERPGSQAEVSPNVPGSPVGRGH